MSASFDLLEREWIPVVWLPDAPEPKPPEVGIRDALLRAHEIKCLSHTAPFIEFGLYRLLITIVLDAHIVAGKRPTIGKMREMLAAGRFDDEVLSKYLQRYAGGFDLWDEECPFLQPKPAAQARASAVANLFPAVPSGANVIHWHHFLEGETKSQFPGAARTLITEEEAAHWLTTISPFTFKGKIGAARTLAGDPPMYALVLGASLFQTLVLNLPRPNGRVTANQERDSGPPWRTPLQDLSSLPKTPTAAQGLTWPVRHIKLEPRDERIAKSVYTVAYKRTEATRINAPVFDAGNGWRDPNAGTETTQEAINHIKARPGVPVWRDAVPLFLVASEGEVLRGKRPWGAKSGVVRRSRPEVVTNALRLLEAPQFRVAAYGMRKKGGGGGDVKVEEWFRAVLSLPTELARDTRLSSRALEAFRLTQKVADALQIALRMLRPKMEATPRERKKLYARWRNEEDALAGFWQALEPLLARSYLDDLAAQKADAETVWRDAVRCGARKALSSASAPHRRTADGLFRVANASNHLARRLARLLPKERQS